MGVFSIILLILFIIVSLLLIGIVAIQDEETSGLGGIFGGNDSATAFGSKTSKVVTKLTAILGIAFMVLALALALVNRTPSEDLAKKAENAVATSEENWYSN